MKATAGFRAPTSGAMIPPSLWPIRPTFCLFTSARLIRNATPASSTQSPLRRRREAAGRLRHAAIVDPEHHDALAREVIGQRKEWPVPHQALVAVLGAGTRNEKDGGKGPGPPEWSGCPRA